MEVSNASRGSTRTSEGMDDEKREKHLSEKDQDFLKSDLLVLMKHLNNSFVLNLGAFSCSRRDENSIL